MSPLSISTTLRKNLNAPIISIIVATRNREAVLARFLESLARLPRMPEWELVVVNNGSVDGTHSILALAAERLPLVAIYEPRPGKSRALNAALAVAKGELLVFADDDIVPSPTWLSAIYSAAIANPEANIFGGRIMVKKGDVPRWIAASHNLQTLLLSEQDLGDRSFQFSYDRYPVGPNLAVRRDKLEEKCARWPVRLGPGTRIPVGDETVFLMQISLPNAPDRLYVPDSTVLHAISGRPLSVSNCAKRCFLGGFVAGSIKRRYRITASGMGGVAQLASQRLTRCSSFWELWCISMRAIGVLAGKLSPYPRIVDECR